MPAIRTLLSGLGLLVALAIAVAAPAGYFIVASADSAQALAFKARLSAGRAARFISGHEQLWQYQSVRLAELVEFPLDGEEQVRQRITDLKGKVVLQEMADILPPFQHVRLPIIVDGRNIGWLDAEVSLRPVLVGTGYVALASCLLGLVAWLTVRLLPLRVLDSTLLALSDQSARFQAALDNMTQGLCMFDAEGRLVVHNRRFDDMFGAPDPATAEFGALAKRMLRDRGLEGADAAQPGERDGGARTLPDGRIIQVSRQAIGEEGWVATYEDISERRQFQDRLSYMARHDALTGLPNRVMLLEDMEIILPLVRRAGRLAVLGIDLDRFKAVNDMLGHAAGDELLSLVAKRLKEQTREADIVARFGGDEFAILQVNAEQPKAVTALADRLVKAMQDPFEIGGQRVEISASIGVALTDETMATSEELLRDADIALYRAKANGRSTWCFFAPEMDAEIRKQRHLEADLRRALAEGQFELYYQPLIEARTSVLVGFEALLRWHHPDRGMVAPAEFIPMAEQIGLMKAIGAWVLRQACADAAHWPASVKIAVNLSSAQFVKGMLTEQVKQALAAASLPANRLELEITESVLLENNPATLDILTGLRELGVHIAMDDFGTGYSSLSYLRRFPFDKIKIDGSFTATLGQEKSSIEIIRAVVGLGKALGMEVLAEGVETKEQLGILESEGCGQMQGYLFSEPRPVQDVQGIIAAHLEGMAGHVPGPSPVGKAPTIPEPTA